MAVDQIVISQLVKIGVNKSVDFFFKLLTKRKSTLKKELNTGLTTHIKKAISFSENISLFRLPDSRKILENSIQLEIVNQDRRFTSISSRKNISESDILNDLSNFLLLGDVGSGKTTTLKRLVKKTFNTLFSTEIEDPIYSFPIVIKLGEIKKNETLSTHICSLLGIKYDIIEHKDVYTETKIRKEEVYNEETEEMEIVEREEDVKRVKITYEYKIGDYSIEVALGEFLNDLNCIIFIDGLDEVHFAIKEVVFNEIKQISQIIQNSKMIITSRYISEVSSFKQFEISEICPLTKEQKRSVSLLWLEKPDLFLNKLKKLPYADLADRPLFLNYLLLLFINNNDKLPTQAIDVYRQIVLMVIREWDADKEINIYRYSKYKTFDTYKKEDFLSELAFELTYHQNVKKAFSHKQLKIAYLNIYKRYPGLNQKDSQEILKDIESHNGLVFEVYNNNFEFSHLSLQEYLAARYIVSIPFNRRHYELLNTYASPLAIANVLSPKPDEWFAMLFLEQIREQRISYQLNGDGVYEYLDRLIVEKIIFTQPSTELGLALIYLKSKFKYHRVKEKLVEFLKIKYVLESVKKAASYYSFKKKGNEYLFELKRKHAEGDLSIKALEKGSISSSQYWK